MQEDKISDQQSIKKHNDPFMDEQCWKKDGFEKAVCSLLGNSFAIFCYEVSWPLTLMLTLMLTLNTEELNDIL